MVVSALPCPCNTKLVSKQAASESSTATTSLEGSTKRTTFGRFCNPRAIAIVLNSMRDQNYCLLCALCLRKQKQIWRSSFLAFCQPGTRGCFFRAQILDNYRLLLLAMSRVTCIVTYAWFAACYLLARLSRELKHEEVQELDNYPLHLRTLC